MKNASKYKGQKALAMAIVAMFALCAFAVCIPTDSDAGVYGGVVDKSDGDKINQTYDVDIAVGQKFVYDNIKTNLDSSEGTVVITGSENAGNTAETSKAPSLTDSTSSGKKFEIQFSSAGSYTYVIKAVWNYSTQNLSQTATQTFNFIVSEQIILPTSYNGYGIKDGELKAFSIPYKGPATGTIAITTYAGEGEENLVDGSNLFDAVIEDGNILVTPKSDVSKSVASYGFKITVTNSANKDSDSVNVKYQVFEEVIVTVPENVYTYEGNKDTPENISFSTNWDDAEDPKYISYELTVDKDDNANGDVLSVDETDKRVVKISGIKDASVGSIVKSDATKAVFTAKFKATGTVKNGENTPATYKTPEVTSTVTVYKALAFASAPTVDNISTNALTAAGTSISLSSYIGGAYKVVYDWGDGTQTSSMDNGSKVGTTYSAYHAYAKAGTYTITIYATNDQGTTTAQIFHSSNGVEMAEEQTPGTTEPSADDEEKSFFDEHGFQFLVFAILAILCAIAFFYFGIQSPYVIIIMIVFAALAILCFVYNDIGGIIDAVKDIKL